MFDNLTAILEKLTNILIVVKRVQVKWLNLQIKPAQWKTR